MKPTSLKADINLEEFSTRFSTEEICREYLATIRWNNKPVCPHCKHDSIYQYEDGKLLKCAKCRRQFTIKIGTLFEDSKISLKKWFIAVFLITSGEKELSSVQLGKEIGVTQKTAWFMLNRIRQCFQEERPGRHIVYQEQKPRQPMMKPVNKPFEAVLKFLVKGEDTLSDKQEESKLAEEKQDGEPAYTYHPRDFDPETD